MREPTSCETCDNVHMESRKQPFWKWMCVKFPRLEGMNPVAPTQAVVHEPYNRCANINMGFCLLWQKRRDGQADNGL